MGSTFRQHLRLFSLLMPFLFHSATSNAQPASRRVIDSLQLALRNSQSDSQQITLLTKLSEKYFDVQPDSGKLFGRRAIEGARRINNQSLEVNARLAMAASLWAQGQHLQAIDEYRSVIPYAEKSGNPRQLARILHGIAVNYGAIEKPDKATEFLKKSLAISMQENDDSAKMGCYHNLAHYSIRIGNRKEALDYYEQSMAYAKRAGHEKGIAFSYIRLGEQYAQQGNRAKAIEALEEAYTRYRQLNDTNGMAECLAVRGQVERQFKYYKEAIAHYREAIQLQKQVPGQYFRRIQGGYLIDLASLYQEAPQTAADWQLARNTWSDALDIARMTYDWNVGALSAQALSNLYRKNGRSDLALTYFEEYIRNRDSAINLEKEKQKNLHELQTQYNDSIAVMKKLQEKQLLILRQENELRRAGILQTRLYASIGIVLLALLLSFLLYRNRLQKLRFKNELQQSVQELEQKASALQKQISEATLSALQAQMNPHFMFNSLNVIQSYVYTGDKEQSSRLIGTFSDLVRQTLEFSKSSLISLEDELSFIRSYTELEVNRMSPGLSIVYQIEPSLDLTQIKLPPLLIQPFVENALRHGLYHKEGDRCLRISVSGTMEVALVEIDDNGVGRAAAKEFAKKENHLAFASGANEQRIALLNQLGEMKFELSITDKTELNGKPAGTTVQLHIKHKSTGNP